MRYLDEYRDAAVTAGLARQIARATTRPWILMEVCGGQTHAIVRYGLDRMLPSEVELVHGPGCPVCVTPLELIDRAHSIAARPDVLFTSFGDMLRVPGSRSDLLRLRSRGADVRVVYSPLDALRLARRHPQRRVVFFGVGFETTAPANAMALVQARRQGLSNFSLLASHVLVPPALETILTAPDNRVQAFLGPGHVCAVTGVQAYQQLSARHGVPIVIAGFEPVDLLEGILKAIGQLEGGRGELENPYARAVAAEGNAVARALVEEVFEVTDRAWRGIGTIPRSGLRIRDAYAAYDAERLFEVSSMRSQEPAECISGLVLCGQKKPHDCPAFGRSCTPETPLGATMVSAEGACAAYYAHRRDPAAEASR